MPSPGTSSPRGISSTTNSTLSSRLRNSGGIEATAASTSRMKVVSPVPGGCTSGSVRRGRGGLRACRERAIQGPPRSCRTLQRYMRLGCSVQGSGAPTSEYNARLVSPWTPRPAAVAAVRPRASHARSRPVPADLDQVFKAYDVRGLYPEQLDEDLAQRIGRAFIELTGAGSLAIGQDMRPSSEPMAAALADGATSRGADVIRIGLCSTDMVYYVSGALDVAAIMLTASHNPSQYNGLKFCRPGAVPVGQDSGLADLKRMVADGEPAGDAPTRGQVREGQDLVARYADHVRGFVDKGALRPLKVVADAGNGMAGHVVPVIFERLPFDLVPMYFELDGTFPNHPADPINPRNLADLRQRVVAEGADVGLAFDADAGLVAALVVLEVLSRADRPLSEVLAPYRKYADSGEINRRVEGTDPKAVIERVSERYPADLRDWTDGLTIDTPNWWFNLRPSNTEPLLRLNVEAGTEEEMARVRDEVLEMVGGEPA